MYVREADKFKELEQWDDRNLIKKVEQEPICWEMENHGAIGDPELTLTVW